jgi:hypothetical protein
MEIKPAITRRAIFGGLFISGAPATLKASVVDLSRHCARQLLDDAREAHLGIAYVPETGKFRFSDLSEGARTEAEEDIAFYVKWGLRTRPQLRNAVIELLRNGRQVGIMST